MRLTQQLLEQTTAATHDWVFVSCGRFIDGSGTRQWTEFATNTLHADRWRSRVYVGDVAAFVLNQLCSSGKQYSRQLVGVESIDAMALELNENPHFQPVSATVSVAQ